MEYKEAITDNQEKTVFMEYQEALMYHGPLWNHKKLGWIPSSFRGIPRSFYAIRNAPWNTKTRLWNTKYFLWYTKKIVFYGIPRSFHAITRSLYGMQRRYIVQNTAKLWWNTKKPFLWNTQEIVMECQETLSQRSYCGHQEAFNWNTKKQLRNTK